MNCHFCLGWGFAVVAIPSQLPKPQKGWDHASAGAVGQATREVGPQRDRGLSPATSPPIRGGHWTGEGNTENRCAALFLQNHVDAHATLASLQALRKFYSTTKKPHRWFHGRLEMTSHVPFPHGKTFETPDL